MEILTGGRQSGQNLYNALKLYNYIDSLQNDTTVRVVKKDGICVLCVDESISKEKIKDKIKELNKKEKEELKGMKGQNRYFVKQTYQNKRMILQELIKESEE